jgi:hypothetical protein
MKKTIWFDVDNAPHVQIFSRIIKELAPDYRILVTAKDYGQTLELMSFREIEHTVIGRHPGKHLLNKIFGNMIRVFQLTLWARKKNIDLGVSHCSRAMIIACWLLGIKSLVIFDYEHAEHFILKNLGTYLYVPGYLGKYYLSRIGFPTKKLSEYPGLKENIYLPFFKPDPSILERLNINENEIIVLVRPPSEVSHYNAKIKYDIVDELLAMMIRTQNVRILFSSRYNSQNEKYKYFLKNKNVTLIRKVEDGLNLIYHSDLVISGGGTMNREAAAMHVPVYSIFLGKKPRVDINLEKEGKLAFINNKNDFHKIRIEKREKHELIKKDWATFNKVMSFIKEKAK